MVKYKKSKRKNKAVVVLKFKITDFERESCNGSVHGEVEIAPPDATGSVDERAHDGSVDNNKLGSSDFSKMTTRQYTNK